MPIISIYYLQFPFFPQRSSPPRRDPRGPAPNTLWGNVEVLCSAELITACDWFVVRGDGRMPLDEMNTQRSVMNNKTTAIMSNYTGSHISAPQTHSLWAREARESPVAEEQTWLVEKGATPPPSLFFFKFPHIIAWLTVSTAMGVPRGPVLLVLADGLGYLSTVLLKR